jgi:hypothetical protein
VSDLHQVKITVHGDRPSLTKIEMDGRELKGVISATLFTDTRRARLELAMMADVEIEGETDVVITVYPLK